MTSLLRADIGLKSATKEEEAKSIANDSASHAEEDILRLIDVNASSLAEFKRIVKKLLPKGGKPVKSLEVYIGILTAQQLAHLFELVNDRAHRTMENIIFWKVTFPKSASSVLEEFAERLGEGLQGLKTLMVYCCLFSEESSRKALLTFSTRFLRLGSELNRLWLEDFFRQGAETQDLLDSISQNERIQIEHLDLGQNRCLILNVEALQRLLLR